MSEAAAAAAADDMPTVTRWLVEAEAVVPGTRTLSWAAISLLLNVLFVLGWIVCSFFEVGMRWDLIAVMVSNGFGKLAKLPDEEALSLVKIIHGVNHPLHTRQKGEPRDSGFGAFPLASLCEHACRPHALLASTVTFRRS